MATKGKISISHYLKHFPLHSCSAIFHFAAAVEKLARQKKRAVSGKVKIVATPKRTRQDVKRQAKATERFETAIETEETEDTVDNQPLNKRPRRLVFSANTDAEATRRAHEAVRSEKMVVASATSPSASRVPFGRAVSPSPSPSEHPASHHGVNSPTVPISAPAVHAEPCLTETAIASSSTPTKPAAEPTISPSKASSHRSSSMKIEVTDDFDFNFSDVDNDSDDSHQSVEEVVTMPISAESSAVVEARALVKQVWQTGTLPALGEAMDAFTNALKLLKSSAVAGSSAFSCFQLFLAETPKVAAAHDEAARRLAVSSRNLADLEKEESSSNASKELLRQTGEKHKQEKERSIALEKSIAELKKQLQEQEAELASLSHLPAAKATYEADITEWALKRKEINKQKKKMPMLGKQKKLAEEDKVKAQLAWEKLIHDHSVPL